MHLPQGKKRGGKRRAAESNLNFSSKRWLILSISDERPSRGFGKPGSLRHYSIKRCSKLSDGVCLFSQQQPLQLWRYECASRWTSPACGLNSQTQGTTFSPTHTIPFILAHSSLAFQSIRLWTSLHSTFAERGRTTQLLNDMRSI